jgi:hypothetical protein
LKEGGAFFFSSALEEEGLTYFKASEDTNQATQCHIPEDLNPQKLLKYP